MKSKIFKLFLLLLILYPLPIFARDARTNVVTYRYSGTTCTGSECFGSKAIGLEISILRYNGSGNPSTVGRMLIANEALFGSKTYFVSSGVTAGTTDEIAQRYDFNEGGNSDCNGCHGSTRSCTGPGQTDHVPYNPGDPTGGEHGYIAEETFHYSAGHRITTYDESHITNLDKYASIIRISNNSIPTDSSGLSKWIDDNNIIKKYTGSVSLIKKYFDVNISYSHIDEYYVSIQPVKRVIGGVDMGSSYGSFLYLQMYDEEGEPDNNGIWDWEEVSCNHAYACNPYECGSWSPAGCKPTSGAKCEYNSKTCYRTCYEHKNDYSLVGEPDNYCWVHKYIYKVFGKYAYGYSSIETFRNLNVSSSKLCILLDSKTENAHCELTSIDYTDSNGVLHKGISVCKGEALLCDKFERTVQSNGGIVWKCANSNVNWSEISNKNTYQYYIGPNLEKALVGTQNNNKYIFNNGNCTSNASNSKYAIGIKHYYLPDIISCMDACGSITDKTSDEYLKCSENYCDAEVDFNLKGNAQKRKSACILSACQYSYGKDPTPNDGINNSESINSCSNSSPYNNIEKNNIIVDTNSNCSIDKLTGDDLAKTNAVIANCIGDNVTDFDGDDTNDTIFDHRTYINVACKETSGFNFYDLTNRKFVAGQGIDYWGKLNGERECTVYFNLEQWKFDYATISSKDPDRRKRLLYIYNTYNNALDNNYNPMNDPNYDEIFAEDNAGEVDWESLEYNTSKVSITSKVTEIVNNVVEESLKYTLVSQSEDDSTNTTIVGKDTIKAIQNMNVTNRTVNRYVFTDNIKVMYTFDKYCVSLDGEASVYKAPENGICYVNTNGNNVWGRNVYYTNLNATRNKDFIESIRNQGLGHSITTDVSIGKEVANESPYYKDGESCPYEIDDDSLSCSIIIKNDEGTIMHGNDIYVYGGVTATLKVDERLGVEDEVENVGITTGITPSVNNIKNLNIEISDKKNGVESIYVTGIAESARGVTVKCQKLVHIIDPSDECGVSCSIKKDSDLVYEIVSPEIGNRTQTQTPKAYYTALSTNMSWKTVLKNISDDRYIVRLNRPIGNTYVGNMTQYDETIVYGKVEGTMKNTGEKCYNVCWSDPPELPNCTENYLPSDTSSIKEHCEVYWDKDINNYSSYEDCTNQCSKARMCPDDRRNYEEVEQVCRNNYQEWGYNKASSCINYCYYCPECSADYIYRQIQVYNPFPYSKDSNTLGFNYPTGNRIIPSNWVGKTDYIKQDDGDKTSVTGIHHHQNVEYVIELTRNEIDLIKEDTKKYNNSASGNNAYLDYVYVKGTDETKAYKSKFIHDNENTAIGNIFKVVNGEIVSK